MAEGKKVGSRGEPTIFIQRMWIGTECYAIAKQLITGRKEKKCRLEF